MNFTTIINKVRSLAENDQSIQITDVASWVDDAINQINTSLKTSFPTTGYNSSMDTDTSTSTPYKDSIVPKFDSRWHEALVLFAIAKYRESDSDYQAGQYFKGLFKDMVMQMERDMIIQPIYKADPEVQQITVTDASQMTYNLTMEIGSYFDVIYVYQNNNKVDPSYYSLDVYKKQITFKGITLAVNDQITIDFENNSDTNNPPYSWWGSW